MDDVTKQTEDTLSFVVVSAGEMSATCYDEVLDLCTRAYEEAFAPYLEQHVDPVHVLGYHSGQLICHALWVERWLQIDQGPLLRTAYVEAVATDPAYQGRGHASALLRYLVDQVQDFDLAALGPSDPAFYTRLGWQTWCGPLSVRVGTGLQPTPDSRVMIYALPKTPSFDLNAPISSEWRRGEIW